MKYQWMLEVMIMVQWETLLVLKIVHCLIKMEIIEITHQQFVMILLNGSIQMIYNAGLVRSNVKYNAVFCLYLQMCALTPLKVQDILSY